MRRKARRATSPTAERRLSDDIIRSFAISHDGVAFHAIYPAERSSSVVQLLYSVGGSLDRPALNQGWRRVLQLHAALSARFFRERVTPLPQEPVDAAPALEWKDWRWLPAHERAVCLQAYLQQDRERAFTLAGPPLIRLAVIALGARAHLLLLSVHPLLLQGGSGRLLMMEGLRSLVQRAQPHETAASGHEMAEAG
jgi:hypothetical protein